MSISGLRLRRPTLGGRGGASVAKLHCELDDWWFDARYTDGACPICGWKPEGADWTAPLWMRLYRGADWELTGLFFTAILLVVIGILVERSAGLTPGDLGGMLSGR